MNSNFNLKAIALVIAGVALASGGYWVGSRGNSDAGRMAPPGDTGLDSKTGKKVLYWHDPMVPATKFDKPGKSPFMDMQLVPVYADGGGEEVGVKISSTLQQNLGIRFANVRRVDSRDSLELVGTTQFDESIAEVVQSRVTGYIDHLYARSPMQRVKRGEPIALLFVPDWIAPQEEYLALRQSGNETLAGAARQRMRTMSIPDALVAQAERTGKAQSHFTLVSPVSGIVSELGVREGAMVSPGITVAKIAGTNKVWLLAEVPEALANRARAGMSVTAISSSDPLRKYTGKVREIIPGVSTATRTVQARLELDNKDGSLLPGQLMRIQLEAATSVSRLVVPSEAVITSGKRSVVLVADASNNMRPVIVTLGRESSGDTEVTSGLIEGQKVVASGQFLIDSEANLKGILPKFSNVDEMKPAQAAPMESGPVLHGVARIEKVSNDALTLSHQPIPELQWGAMTMDFKKPRPDSFAGVKQGDNVEFSFRDGKDGYTLENVKMTGGGKK
ncbi:efflux transporter periplasmic adaptor subunit [Janthinobacterium svalbardensis]|uniref:Efflux transporter periplasmic adaptor subunit n=1 Tax=Janthinobacterium svalbardensis TaxID=368607 RepID=A0A290WZ11_9BURK|nr:efflux RND transporter periplasmic adaptor subunit [Janthinobacterium svalbardensis]ATD61938.1 efflux transporter periplasmic adaptor subunit [Janthinobacterium svalbardensis]